MSIDKAYEKKIQKYRDLCCRCRENGWPIFVLPCLRMVLYVHMNIQFLVYSETGLIGNESKTSENEIDEVAEKVSSWLWLRRSDN